MSSSTNEVSGGNGLYRGIERGSHLAYIFTSSSEKQSALFQLCEAVVSSRNSFLLYLAGKQGVKGIRLSLKDTGFDVASYERVRQMKIVDSDEWFLHQDRQKWSFKDMSELREQLTNVIKEATAAGFSFVTVISETDSLVRKGFYDRYQEFDASLGRSLSGIDAAFLCAFDKRELEAAGITNESEDLTKTHSRLV